MKIPEKFTKQSLIEYVVPLLVKQKVKSRNWKGTCQYNGEFGRHCAIGFIIPPELYDPNWDTLGEDVEYISKLIPNIKDLPTGFLMKLQSIHDGTEHRFNTVEFKKYVQIFCEQQLLNSNFLDDLEFKE